jgi:hypothetical protein
LLGLANGKSDTIASRYRVLTTEFRDLKAKEDRTGDDDYRLKQLCRQINLYKERVPLVVDAQCILFRTICIFVTSIAAFISLALVVVIFQFPDAEKTLSVQILLGAIGVSILLGAGCLYWAVSRLLSEVRKAKKTFEIEIEDCFLEMEAGCPAEVFQSVLMRPSSASTP